MELGVADPVPALNAPVVVNQLQQRCWRSAQTGEEQMGGLKGLAVPAAGGRDLHDPAAADPGLPDVLRRLFGPQRQGDVATVADLMIRCHGGDLALSLSWLTIWRCSVFWLASSFGEAFGYTVRRKSAPCS